jgi:large subunit ribosomal protein L21
MYAVCIIPGRQIKVGPGAIIRVDLMNAHNEGDKIVFDKVLLVSDGNKTTVGSPYLGARVHGTVVAHGRDKKIIVYKKKKRTDYHKKRGHKQRFTTVHIDSIEV